MTRTAERPSSTLSVSDQERLRDRLVDDRVQTSLLVERLVTDLDSFTLSRADSPADDEHDPEGPTLAFERSQSAAILGQTRDHLSQIDSAIIRMDAGHYGRCDTCHRDIPVERLEVRPYSTQCVSCASRNRA